LFSHAYFKKDKNRYEFIRLLGPDEYHENVDNNAFTNYQAHFALEVAIAIFERMQARSPEVLSTLCDRLELTEGDVANWQEMVKLLYLPQPDEESLVIEQFDGFFDLEDIPPAELRKRLKDPDEYWGWPSGIAVHAQVLKQADVLQLLAIHDIFPQEVVRANYDYYEPRTEHGSSLSPSMHSVVASKAGYPEQAYEYFLEAGTIDLYNMSKKVISGGSFLGGIHTAACGAVWQVIVIGFAGFRVDNEHLVFQPALPAAWESVSFKLILRANDFTITIAKLKFEISANHTNLEDFEINVNGQVKNIAPSEKLVFREQ
jgi:kojibiose phosphorylase